MLIKVDYKDITLSRLCYYLSESTRGTHTRTMFFSPYLTDVNALHARRSHEKLSLIFAQTRSDIYFLSYCKKLHLVPNGFRLRNPIRHHPDSYVSQAIINSASAKLSNIALHKAYAKQRRLWTLLDSSSLYINEIINVPSLKGCWLFCLG